MTETIQKLVQDHHAWLKGKTKLRQLDNGWVEITTPYLDRHCDYVQIYVKQNGSGFLLTDGGDTLMDLAMTGCELDCPKRQSLLQLTLNGLGVQVDGNELQVQATSAQFPERKLDLVLAILALGKLPYE